MVDANTNGLSDVWENVFSLQAGVPTADPDGDGQNNLQESMAGTDPLNAASVFRLQSVLEPDALVLRWLSVAGQRYQVQSAESPATGSWQTESAIIEGTGQEVLGVVPKLSSKRALFCRLRIVQTDEWALPRAPAVLEYDTDGDGQSDFEEHFAGTDPFDPGSSLRITRMETAKAIRLKWQGVAGKTYVIEGSTNATVPIWSVEGGSIRGVAGPMSVSLLPRGQRQFYRVRVDDADSDSDGVTDWEELMAGTDMGRPFHYRTNFPTSPSVITAMLNASNMVNVEVGRPTANATRGIPASICVVRTGNLAPLTIHYATYGEAVPGTDYEPLSGIVELPAGARSVDIPIRPLALDDLSPAKAMGVSLLPGAGYAVGTNAEAEVNLVQEIALSVKDFGAVGDGITEDTAAIQAAIAALEASSNHNTLHFPAGVYRLNSWGPDNEPTFAWNQILKIGNADLAGRDLFFTGATGAVLYSTVHDVRANMIMARARFRSLTFRGMNWAKEPTALPPTPNGSEPNRASGVFIVNQGYRRVEAVEFYDCTFDNCHGAVDIVAQGYDVRGYLARFGFYRCGVTNRFGPNTTNSWLALGGGQQVRLNPWTGLAIYADNYFEGGSDTPDPIYNPGGRMKDGSHYGSPLRLIFTNNIVRRMGIEAVHQNDDNFMAATGGTFVIPPPGGPTAQVPILPAASTFKPGQLLNFRLWFSPGADATNVLLYVVAYDTTNGIITVTNTGLTPGVVGQTAPSWNPIYLSDYNPTEALIAGNLIENTSASGLSGITANAKATLRGNIIIGFEHGVLTYEPARNPLNPSSRGLVVDANVVLTLNSLNTPPYRARGILTYGPEEMVSNNLIITPNSYAFGGIICRTDDSWIEGNTIIAGTVTHNSYDSGLRALGIGFGYGTTNGTAVANRTRGMDVGVGPEGPYQVNPHRVIQHRSLDVVLSVDPLGLPP